MNNKGRCAMSSVVSGNKRKPCHNWVEGQTVEESLNKNRKILDNVEIHLKKIKDGNLFEKDALISEIVDNELSIEVSNKKNRFYDKEIDIDGNLIQKHGKLRVLLMSLFIKIFDCENNPHIDFGAKAQTSSGLGPNQAAHHAIFTNLTRNSESIIVKESHLSYLLNSTLTANRQLNLVDQVIEMHRKEFAKIIRNGSSNPDQKIAATCLRTLKELDSNLGVAREIVNIFISIEERLNKLYSNKSNIAVVEEISIFSDDLLLFINKLVDLDLPPSNFRSDLQSIEKFLSKNEFVDKINIIKEIAGDLSLCVKNLYVCEAALKELSEQSFDKEKCDRLNDSLDVWLDVNLVGGRFKFLNNDYEKFFKHNFFGAVEKSYLRTQQNISLEELKREKMFKFFIYFNSTLTSKKTKDPGNNFKKEIEALDSEIGQCRKFYEKLVALEKEFNFSLELKDPVGDISRSKIEVAKILNARIDNTKQIILQNIQGLKETLNTNISLNSEVSSLHTIVSKQIEGIKQGMDFIETNKISIKKLEVKDLFKEVKN